MVLKARNSHLGSTICVCYHLIVEARIMREEKSSQKKSIEHSREWERASSLFIPPVSLGSKSNFNFLPLEGWVQCSAVFLLQSSVFSKPAWRMKRMQLSWTAGLVVLSMPSSVSEKQQQTSHLKLGCWQTFNTDSKIMNFSTIHLQRKEETGHHKLGIHNFILQT